MCDEFVANIRSAAAKTSTAENPKPPKPRLLPFYFWLMSLANLALILLAFLLFSSGPDPRPRPVRANPEVTSAIVRSVADDHDLDALNAYGQSIARAGLKNCAVPMSELTQRLFAGKQVGIYRFPATQENSASLSMEVTADNGALLYLTFNLSQGPDGACQIAYEAVSDWANSCKEVMETIFKEFVPSRQLLKSVGLLKHKENQRRKVFAMPVQNGCIAIEKEIFSNR